MYSIFLSHRGKQSMLIVYASTACHAEKFSFHFQFYLIPGGKRSMLIIYASTACHAEECSFIFNFILSQVASSRCLLFMHLPLATLKNFQYFCIVRSLIFPITGGKRSMLIVYASTACHGEGFALFDYSGPENV